jgi:hypothetical protein
MHRPLPGHIVRLVVSGPVWPASENVALHVGVGLPTTISVPTRSQPGARSSLRIHAWTSVEPAGNGVAGGTIGLGAESQKKSLLDRMRRIGISIPHRGGAELL